MTHCAIVPFITVAHIHLERIHRFSLILECVLSGFFSFCLFVVFFPPHVPSPSPSAQQCLQLPQHSRGVWPVTPHLLVWNGTNCYLLSPAGSGVLFSPPRLIPVEKQRLNLNTVHFLLMNLCLSFRNCFCIIIILLLWFSCLKNRNLHVTNLKYTT